MSSDGDWGAAETDSERARFDEWCRDYGPLPHGDPAVVSFCLARNLEPADLERVGVRFSPPSTLAFYYPEGIKTRDLMRLAEPGGGRASEPGVRFTRLKVLPALDAGEDGPDGLIVAEGETDAARLIGLYPLYAVGILPAGAKAPTDAMIAQASAYPRVLVALDDDDAGNKAAAAWLDALPRSSRLKPPGNDWCSSDEPSGGWAGLVAPPAKRLYTARELIDAELGDQGDNHWFVDGILPVAGFQIIHAAPKSLKSFVVLDEIRALATGTSFAEKYAFTRPHPARVLLYQYEIPPADFRNRLVSVLMGVTDQTERDLLLDNLIVRGLADNTRPRIKIGPGFLDDVRRDIEECDADVVVFDPFQKMTGTASINDAHEMEPLFDAVDVLRSTDAITVIGLHHNNKTHANSRDPLAMSGSQRFAADPDSIVSVTVPAGTKDGDDGDRDPREKTRDITFELRNGVATGTRVHVAARLDDPDLVVIRFGRDSDEPANPTTTDLF